MIQCLTLHNFPIAITFEMKNVLEIMLQTSLKTFKQGSPTGKNNYQVHLPSFEH